MTDEFLDAESSIESSVPREYAEITHGTTTYRIAFSERDLLGHDGRVYTAVAASRGALVVAGAGKEAELVLTLPINHALVRRYLQQGVPPNRITVTVWRRQMMIGVSEQIWAGDVSSMSWDDDCTEASFRIPARTSEALARTLPVITAGRKCPHVLGDAACRIDFETTNPDGIPYKSTLTVISVVGRDVRVDLSTVPLANSFRSKWARNGKLKHLASGESMSIIEQTDLDPSTSTVTRLTLQFPIAGLVAGNSVEVYVGCDWKNPTCKSKFNNLSRYGGCSFMPEANPFVLGFPVEQ